MRMGSSAASEGGGMTGARKRWVKGRHKWKWLRPKNYSIGRCRRESDALRYEFATWDQLSDEAFVDFERSLLNTERQASARVRV